MEKYIDYAFDGLEVAQEQGKRAFAFIAAQADRWNIDWKITAGTALVLLVICGIVFREALIKQIVVVAVKWFSKSSFHAHDKSKRSVASIKLPNGRKGTIIRDDWGVPHIYSESKDTLYFLLGYAHAQDRLFQMEVLRRAANGRLSEFIGEDAVSADAVARTFGWATLSSEDWQAIAKEAESSPRKQYSKLAHEAYAEGVNHYMETMAAKPAEIKLSGLKLEPWRPEDSIGILRVICFQMTFGFQQKLVRQLMVETLGHDIAKLMWFYSAQDLPTHLQSEEPWRVPESIAGEPAAKTAFHDPRVKQDSPPAPSPRQSTTSSAAKFLKGLIPHMKGSNWWILSGKRTASGKPILTNDPHLDVTTPPMWYEAHLHQSSAPGETQESKAAESPHSDSCLDTPLHVTGYTVPGVHGHIIFHNDNIAMGITLTYADVEDAYVEKFVGKKDEASNHQVQYLHDGKPQKVALRKEVIEVKDGKPVELWVRSTHHGPVISDIPNSNYETLFKVILERGRQQSEELRANDDVSLGVSIASVAIHPRIDVNLGLMELNHSRNYEEFQGHFKHVPAPSLNVSYADKEGNVGYQMSGWIPKRRFPLHREATPVPGWDSFYDWQGFYRGAECPHMYNPESGFIVSGNHAIASVSNPDRLTSWYEMGDKVNVDHHDGAVNLGSCMLPPFRAMAIEKLILQHSKKRVTVEDCKHWLLDVHCIVAERFCRHLEDLEVHLLEQSRESETVRHVCSVLRDWDGNMTTTSKAALYYSVLRVIFFRKMIASFYSAKKDSLKGIEFPNEEAVEQNSFIAGTPDGIYWPLCGGGIHEELKDWSCFEGQASWFVLHFLDSSDTLRQLGFHITPILLSSIEALSQFLRENPKIKTWGDAHKAHFPHPFEDVFETSKLNPPDLPLGGDEHTIAAAGFSTNGSFTTSSGGSIASLRLIMDTHDWDNSACAMPLGQSGKVGSRHYYDQMHAWNSGKLKPMPFSKNAVAKHSRHILRFTST